MGSYISYGMVSAIGTRTRFLGIMIDSEKLELSLPYDKLDKMRDILGKMWGRRKASEVIRVLLLLGILICWPN